MSVLKERVCRMRALLNDEKKPFFLFLLVFIGASGMREQRSR